MPSFGKAGLANMDNYLDKYEVEKLDKEISVKEYIEGYVNVEEFLEYCKACPNYEKIWSCPPYDFDPVEDYWKKYNMLEIYGYKIKFKPDVTVKESERILERVKATVSRDLFKKEAEIPGSVSLSAGNCTVCGHGNCSRPEGKPCRFARDMRYSIESLGGNVGKTVHDFLGCDLEWVEEGKVPSHYILVGGLLKP